MSDATMMLLGGLACYGLMAWLLVRRNRPGLALIVNPFAASLMATGLVLTVFR
jgi:hypothetical protein